MNSGCNHKPAKILVVPILVVLWVASGTTAVAALDWFQSMEAGDVSRVETALNLHSIERIGDATSHPEMLRGSRDFLVWRPESDMPRGTYDLVYLARRDVDRFLHAYDGTSSRIPVTMVLVYLGPTDWKPDDPRAAAPTGGFTFHRYLGIIQGVGGVE